MQIFTSHTRTRSAARSVDAGNEEVRRRSNEQGGNERSADDGNLRDVGWRQVEALPKHHAVDSVIDLSEGGSQIELGEPGTLLCDLLLGRSAVRLPFKLLLITLLVLRRTAQQELMRVQVGFYYLQMRV